ncbi:hypothetical protein GUITHDRAFT_153082, partial [Guillardia theta CCMP2712]
MLFQKQVMAANDRMLPQQFTMLVKDCSLHPQECFQQPFSRGMLSPQSPLRHPVL